MRIIWIAGNRRQASAHTPIRTRAKCAALAMLALTALLALLASGAEAQGSRKDDVVFGPGGHPVPGATVTVCQASATGTPCAPLASIYTDATLTVPAANPLQTDGIGNYHFYAPAGRYVVQISGPGISGTLTYRDVILAPDVSSSSSGNNISAFGLTLGGNLSVAGNATVNGTLTSGIFAPSSVNIGGNEAIKGPRPYVDVTAPPYGAKGDGATDDTAAISNAINAACAMRNGTGTGHSIPDVYFPPGFYLLSQPQTPSTSAVLPMCSGLHLIGGGSLLGYGQFSMAPQATLLVNVPGASPNAMPVFELDFPNNGTTIENLAIYGYNQAVGTHGASWTTFKNVSLEVGVTGMADNAPLKLANQLWFWYKGGTITSNNSHSLDEVLIVGDSGPGNVNANYLFYFSDLIMIGGAIHYDQRVGVSGAPPGGFVFRNIVRESSSVDFLYATTTGGGAYELTDLTFDHVSDSDSVGTNYAAINFNVPGGGLLDGVTMNHVGFVRAITMTSGTLLGSTSITTCDYACTGSVTDGSGNPIAGASVQTTNGTDFFANSSDVGALTSDVPETFPQFSSAAPYGPPARFTVGGSYFASLGINPSQGYMFNSGTAYGYDASFKPGSTPASIDVSFPVLYPPTAVTGTPTTGGTLAAGTYYYFVAAETALTCSGTLSAPSLASNAVTISGGNNAASLSWTLPATSALTSVAGYCVYRGTANHWTTSLYYANVAGSGTTTYTDTGTMSCCVYNRAAYLTYQSQHRFTPTSLGIGTANPLFNLDVAGTTARLGGVSIPLRTASAPPYTPACLAAATCYSFMPLTDTVEDSFTRANSSTLGQNWTQSQGTVGISSNAAVGTALNTWTGAYYSGQTWNADQFAQATISVTGAANLALGPAVRGSASGNYYQFWCNTGSGASLDKFVAGARTVLTTAGAACAVNDVMRLEVVGSTLRAYYNGALLITWTDSALTSGSPGVAFYNNSTAALVNWSGGNLKPGYNQLGYWNKMQAFGPGVTLPETTAPSASTGNDVCYGDSTAHTVKCSYNNGSFLNVPQVIASGTSTLGTTAISATSCATVVTSAATGVTSSDAIEWSFNAAPGTGYTAGLHVLPYVTSGNVNFLVCNPTAGSLTPAAATLNWRVVR